jgi:serine/threonine-protein kinase RsbT
MYSFSVNIEQEEDIFLAISRARYLIKGRFSLEDEQAVYVTICELTRNVLNYANRKGVFRCDLTNRGFEITVEDEGPGIANLDDILSGQYQSNTGLGLGLRGVQRMMDEFIVVTSERGTTIRVCKKPSGHTDHRG